MREAGEIPDPREAQIARLKGSRTQGAENTKLKERLPQAAQGVDQLTDFRTQAPARLAARYEEIIRLREAAAATTWVSRLPPPRTTAIGTRS